MEGLTISKSSKGKRSVYKTTFTKPGSIKKFSEYLKTNNIPQTSVSLGVNLISVNVKSEGEIERIMTSPFPESSVATSLIGNEPVHVKYEIAFDDSTLVLKAVNPERIKKLFKFTEVLTVSESNGILTFEREAEIFNAGTTGFFGRLTSGLTDAQKFDDFFNNSNLTFYVGVVEEMNK